MVSSPKMVVLRSISPCKTLLISAVIFYFAFIYLSNHYPNCPSSGFFVPFLKNSTHNIDQTHATSNPRTNLSHLVFGLVGSENAWHHRKSYIESWWRPNTTRGFLFLDKPPTGGFLPWSPLSPDYKISDDLTKLLDKNDITAQRIIHAIMETYREEHENLRWLVMGDDDSIFFLDNIVDVVAEYDHTRYYYLGGHSEFILSNYWYSFRQGFGGAGFILSFPLAKALAKGMENCLRRYKHLKAADQTTMSCIADIGVSLTALKGIHQIDLRGDISGFLSSHPQFPLMSLHHFDMVDPIFPAMDRFESTRHLMTAAKADQSRMLQQTICHHRPTNWSFSISWGYSAHIYERIMPRSYLQYPIETFKTWTQSPRAPHYMFNTRQPSGDPCEAPHVFFYRTVENASEENDGILMMSFSRAWPRGLPTCAFAGNYSADSISRIQVYSPASKRFDQMDRSECCDIVRVDEDQADVRLRECTTDEIIA